MQSGDNRYGMPPDLQQPRAGFASARSSPSTAHIFGLSTSGTAGGGIDLSSLQQQQQHAAVLREHAGLTLHRSSSQLEQQLHYHQHQQQQAEHQHQHQQLEHQHQQQLEQSIHQQLQLRAAAAAAAANSAAQQQQQQLFLHPALSANTAFHHVSGFFKLQNSNSNSTNTNNTNNNNTNNTMNSSMAALSQQHQLYPNSPAASDAAASASPASTGAGANSTQHLLSTMQAPSAEHFTISAFHSKTLNPAEDSSVLQQHQQQQHNTTNIIRPTAAMPAANSNTSEWKADETAALVKITESSFREGSISPRGSLIWEEVSRKLQELGYQRSPKRCREKYERIQRFYKKAKYGNAGEDMGLEFSSEFSSSSSEEEGDGGGNADDNDVDGREPHLHGGALQLIGGPNAADHHRQENTEAADQYRYKKKKRKLMRSTSRTRSFFERLTKQIMEKQEELHRAFLQTIERKDRERSIREEAYRKQEAARLNREQEIRAQEVALTAARDAALIAFLEKTTGHSLSSLPKVGNLSSNTTYSNSSPNSLLNIQGGGAGQPTNSNDFHLHHHQSGGMGHLSTHDPSDMDNNSDLNTRRWPKVEVHALIRLRSGMEPRFREAGPKAHLWQEISASMACLGFIRSPKRCKEKWENINKYFKKTKDSCKKRPENAKTCPYFHQLDTLYERGILASSGSGSSSQKIHGKGDNLLEYKPHDSDDNNRFSIDGQENMQMNNGGSGDQESNASDSAELAIKLHQVVEQQGKAKEMSSDQVGMLEGSHCSSIFAFNNNQNQGNVSGSSSASIMLSQHNMDKFLHPSHEPINVMVGGSSTKKSMQVEMFVKDILDLQQQQHQKLVEEYDRMEQAHELRELERQQLKVAHTHDNATLMALVHKLAGDSNDLTMSAPSGME